MLWELWRYWSRDRIARYWIDPEFHFSYYGFDWVQPWPGDGMYYHFAVMAVCAVFMLIGLWYRLSATLFFLGFTYIFLLDAARYLNHFYLVALISFLMILVPAHRLLSVDVLRQPQIKSQTAPAWSLWLLQFQIGIPYFYGGVAKLNGDWLRGEPLRMWLASRTSFPVIGQWFTEEWMVYLMNYGAVLLDLLVVPFLLWRRTRWAAFILALAFHLANVELFSIGIFPWFMMAATVMFFEPDWPRQLARRCWTLLTRVWGRPDPQWQAATTAAAPPKERPLATMGAGLVPRWRTAVARRQTSSAPLPQLTRKQTLLLGFLGFYVVLQLLVPLRHWAYPGDVAWTEEGHRFSWRMKLRSNRGRAEFFVRDPETDIVTRVWPEDHLARHQVGKLAGRPYMILQFSHYLAERFTREDATEPVEVRAKVRSSLNGRVRQTLIDPEVDLAKVPIKLPPSADWVLPLDVPLEARRRP